MASGGWVAGGVPGAGRNGPRCEDRMGGRRAASRDYTGSGAAAQWYSDEERVPLASLRQTPRRKCMSAIIVKGGNACPGSVARTDLGAPLARRGERPPPMFVRIRMCVADGRCSPPPPLERSLVKQVELLRGMKENDEPIRSLLRSTTVVRSGGGLAEGGNPRGLRGIQIPTGLRKRTGGNPWGNVSQW